MIADVPENTHWFVTGASDDVDAEFHLHLYDHNMCIRGCINVVVKNSNVFYF